MEAGWVICSSFLKSSFVTSISAGVLDILLSLFQLFSQIFPEAYGKSLFFFLFTPIWNKSVELLELLNTGGLVKKWLSVTCPRQHIKSHLLQTLLLAAQCHSVNIKSIHISTVQRALFRRKAEIPSSINYYNFPHHQNTCRFATRPAQNISGCGRGHESRRNTSSS